MYVPGAWLKTGTNEIIILDLFGPDKPAIAELYLLHANNKPLSHEVWTIAYVDSEKRTGEDGTASGKMHSQTIRIASS